jgi:hypothetical protein
MNLGPWKPLNKNNRKTLFVKPLREDSQTGNACRLVFQKEKFMSEEKLTEEQLERTEKELEMLRSTLKSIQCLYPVSEDFDGTVKLQHFSEDFDKVDGRPAHYSIFHTVNFCAELLAMANAVNHVRVHGERGGPVDALIEANDPRVPEKISLNSHLMGFLDSKSKEHVEVFRDAFRKGHMIPEDL